MCDQARRHPHGVDRPGNVLFLAWRIHRADISGAVLEETRLNLMAMDPPDHTALRKAIREPFSAGGVARLASTIEEIAHDVVDAIAAKGAIEFVDEVASEIPLRILAHLLGVDEADRRTFYAWSNA